MKRATACPCTGACCCRRRPANALALPSCRLQGLNKMSRESSNATDPCARRNLILLCAPQTDSKHFAKTERNFEGFHPSVFWELGRARRDGRVPAQPVRVERGGAGGAGGALGCVPAVGRRRWLRCGARGGRGQPQHIVGRHAAGLGEHRRLPVVERLLCLPVTARRGRRARPRPVVSAVGDRQGRGLRARDVNSCGQLHRLRCRRRGRCELAARCFVGACHAPVTFF